MGTSPERLVDYVARIRSCSLRQAKALLDAKAVFVNGRRVWMAKHPVTDADRVDIHAKSTPSVTARIEVLLDADDIWIVNKPAGMLTTGRDSAEERLQNQTHNRSLRAVHRLDKGTSGCLCIAQNRDAFNRMVEHFRHRRVTKIYQAIVRGSPQQEGSCSLPLDGRSALTHWRVLETTSLASHLQIQIETGRTHQIRRHLARIGYPILGDPTYHTGRIDDPRIQRIPRPMLHAASFAAPLAKDQTPCRVRAPLPSDFRKILKTLNFCFDPRSNGT